MVVLSQISADDSNATYRMQILRKGILFGYIDNDDNDNLPSNSVAITQDRFGHTVIVADVDNDNHNETIIVGKDYLKIFGNESYLQSAPPLELLLNDGLVSPDMAGGALVSDIDQDLDNELLIGCNNGTLLILEITDSGSDTLSYSVLYRNDFGSSLGKRSSIEFFDYDNDGVKEIIFGDNFGKITILGYGSPPTVTVTSPSMDTVTSLAAVEITWNAQAFITMHHYDLYVNNAFVGRAGAGQTTFLATLIEGENIVNITGYDILGINSSDYVRITQSLAPPSVIISSPTDNFLTRASSIQVDYSYFDPGDNFDHVEIYRNGSVVEASTTATTYLIPLPTDGIWNITIVAEDTFGNRGKDAVFVIRDNTSPEFAGQTILGSQVLGSGTIDIQSSDSIVLTTTISDNFDIQQVNATVSGNGYNETFTMTLQSGTPATGAIYSVTLNLSALDLGNYQIQIFVIDDAGNSQSQSFNFTLVNLIAIPWILQSYNLYYVAGGSLVTIILVTLLAVAIRRRVVNLGWQKEIVAVSYVFNGLPCVYIQNVPELVKDELLFGGALTGIRGILEEITGEKSTLEIQTVEMNQKIVLICPGEFGDAVLMVNKIKPIHKSKLKEFTQFFEKEYRHTLKQEDQIFTPETFRAASILVESFFGINENIQLVDDCEFEVIEEPPDIDLGTRAISMDQVQDLPPTPEETTAATEAYTTRPEIETTQPPIDRREPVTKKMEIPEEVSVESLIRQLPQQSQNVMIYTIELTQNAINSLLERKFDDAARISTIIIENLEQLLTSGTTNKRVDMVIKALLSVNSIV
jgi:hypothetical protein